MTSESDISSQTMTPVRVLVVDDHAVLRGGLVDMINDSPGLTVCGEASTLAAALDAVAVHHPDVVIVDVSLGHDSGFDLLEALRRESPECRVLMLSGHDEKRFAEQARCKGAAGYLVKGQAFGHLVMALRQVAAGELYFGTTRR